MSTRDDILAAVRKNVPPNEELPSLEQDWIAYDDLRATFVEMVNAVGGTVVVVPDIATADAHLAELPAYASAKVTCSLVEAVGRSTLDATTIDDGHDYKDVEFVVIPGAFGVAENGAIWLTEELVHDRVLPFISQHLSIVLPAESLLPHMHAAYARLYAEADGTPFANPGFGVFLSGPSKTADIEQSLVIGAHGARSLTVYLVEET